MPGHYDEYRSYHEAPVASNRAVGIALAAALAVAGLFPLLKGKGVREWALGAAAALLLLALARPGLLAPVARAWLSFGRMMSRAVNFVILAALFYTVVTPMAFVQRLRRKDHLRLRLNPSTASYWLDRVPPGPARESMTDQF